MTEPIQWRRASSRDSNGGNCIEVAFGARGVVMLRSSDEPEEIMFFPAEEWTDFVDGIRRGEFDRPD